LSDGAVRGSAVTFYARRLRRILPAFAFFTAVYLLLICIFGKNPHGAPVSTSNVITNMAFLTPAVHPFSGEDVSLGFIPGTWSLTPEMWFYCLLPIIALISSKKLIHWLVILAFVTFGSV